MDTLTRFELRKIMRRKSFYTGILILTVTVILLASLLVTNTSMTGKDGDFIHGLDAIQLEREYNRQLAGPLTVEKIAETIKKHQELTNDPGNLDEKGRLTIEANAKYDVKNNQIYSLIASAFTPASEYNYYIVDELKPSEGKEFYQQRLERVNEYLNKDSHGNGNYSSEEKAFFIKKNESLQVPFQIDYVSGWKSVFENMPSLFLIASFVIAIFLAPVFAGEYQSGAESIILASRFGRNKVITSKLKASFIVSIGVILFALTSYTLLLLMIYGFDGGSANIQTIKLLAPVPYTVFKTYLWSVFIGSMACLFIGALTLWLSSRLRTPFYVIIASGFFLIAPMLIPTSRNSRLFNHVMNIFPANMFDSVKKVTGYEVIHIFGHLIPTYKVMVGFSLIAIVLLLPLSYRVFKNHQVAN